jgi:hypothetical protein
MARGFFVLFHIWTPSTIFPHLNLLHSPFHKNPTITAPILQTCLSLLISKLMFKEVSQCIPTESILFSFLLKEQKHLLQYFRENIIVFSHEVTFKIAFQLIVRLVIGFMTYHITITIIDSVSSTYSFLKTLFFMEK